MSFAQPHSLIVQPAHLDNRYTCLRRSTFHCRKRGQELTQMKHRTSHDPIGQAESIRGYHSSSYEKKTAHRCRQFVIMVKCVPYDLKVNKTMASTFFSWQPGSSAPRAVHSGDTMRSTARQQHLSLSILCIMSADVPAAVEGRSLLSRGDCSCTS